MTLMNHFKLPRSLVDREKFILEMCARKKVLHLGCADAPYTAERLQTGTWLHDKVTAVSAECLGVDMEQKSIEWLAETHGITNIVCGNAEALDSLNDTFDVVLAGEIIEHLNNPGNFLETARRVLKPNGKLLITTTNAFCLRRFLRIPFGYESIHPDHTYYYSHATLEALAGRFGYCLQAAHAYRLPNRKPLLPYLLERLACAVTPNWAEGIVHVYTVPPQVADGSAS